MRKVADTWSRRAAREGFPARSVFKLQEIDDKYKYVLLCTILLWHASLSFAR
jgi:23S rRNA U2552 (ribose-2'-O)-methylase RlmE/FtsJ